MRLLSALLACATFVCAPATAALAQLAAGDLAWARRAETLDDRLANPARIAEAIGHYRAALEEDPLSLETAWKLLRALHYAIDFTSLDEPSKAILVTEAVEIASAEPDGPDAKPAIDGDRARLFFWSAIAWGAQLQRVSTAAIVREGMPGRMKDYAEQSLAIDPKVERGGALRLLSRLHATVPRVPFISGWVDRDLVLPLAERAYDVDPEHPGNRLILALALGERATDRESQARSLLETVALSEPRADYVVEDLAIREQAREQLEALTNGTR